MEVIGAQETGGVRGIVFRSRERRSHFHDIAAENPKLAAHPFDQPFHEIGVKPIFLGRARRRGKPDIRAVDVVRDIKYPPPLIF